jgi:hypothetical protein
MLATVGAGIRSTTEKYAESSNLFDQTQPLAHRIRYARLRSGAHRWWRAQLEQAKSDSQIRLVLLPHVPRTQLTSAAHIFCIMWPLVDSAPTGMVAANAFFTGHRHTILIRHSPLPELMHNNVLYHALPERLEQLKSEMAERSFASRTVARTLHSSVSLNSRRSNLTSYDEGSISTLG